MTWVIRLLLTTGPNRVESVVVVCTGVGNVNFQVSVIAENSSARRGQCGVRVPAIGEASKYSHTFVASSQEAGVAERQSHGDL